MDRHFLEPFKYSKEMLQWSYSRIAGELLYLSADIRNAGFKLAPVDVNMFPAGFHVLSEESQRLAAKLIRERYTGKVILLIIETHTRNAQYLNNVRTLKNLFEEAKNTVILGNLDNQKLESLHTEAFHIHGKQVITENGTIPDIIVLNDDMISEDPSILANVTQPCIPSPMLGWCTRTKSQYFSHYTEIVEKFSTSFDLDPWLLSLYSESCDSLDFSTHVSLIKLAEAVDRTIEKIQEKYMQRNIPSEPFVFIKANSGSYGMGILTVSSGKEVLSLNKKNRNKLKVTKGSTAITNVIVQEGIETVDTHNGHPSEILMYSVLGKKIAFAERYNTKHTARQNLNSSGMHFSALTQMRQNNVQLHIVSDLIIIAAEKEAQAVAQDCHKFL